MDTALRVYDYAEVRTNTNVRLSPPNLLQPPITCALNAHSALRIDHGVLPTRAPTEFACRMPVPRSKAMINTGRLRYRQRAHNSFTALQTHNNQSSLIRSVESIMFTESLR